MMSPPAEEKLFHATRIDSQLNKQLSYLGKDIRNASRKEKAKVITKPIGLETFFFFLGGD